MTLRELVREGEEQLKKAGVPDARHDARRLFLDTFHISAAEYILYAENTPEQVFSGLGEGLAMPLGYYRDRIRMRAARIPLQQILGEASFMGLDFKVNAFTLCPRPDTEILVEEVLKDLGGPKQKAAGRPGQSVGLNAAEAAGTPAVKTGEKADPDGSGKQGLRLLDLCTGTGCIGISLGLLGGFSEVTLTDLSKEALEVARFNAEKLAAEARDVSVTVPGAGGMAVNMVPEKNTDTAAAGNQVQFSFYQGDLFDALPAGFTCDVIVSNPPYIPDAVIETLEPEVKTYEPRLALSGGKDGLEIYRRLICEAPEFAPALYLEIGCDQAEAVAALMRGAGYQNIRVIRDYGDHDRVIMGIL